jgi:PAS domain S-box-containing protein
MSSSRIKLLLVDDSEVDRMAFERFVQKASLSYDHQEAASIAEGEQLLKNDTFDVVLLDYSLKDGTAFDLLGQVPTEIPVVVITGSGNEEVAVKAMKLGASDYLIKDQESNWLKTVPITVDNAIKVKRAERALKAAHAELELRVEARTAELVIKNRQLLAQIEQREKAEEALRQSQERFRSLTETTSEWIWEIDTNGVITYASPRVFDLLGYHPKQIVGKKRFDLMPDKESQRVEHLFLRLAKSHQPFKDLESWNTHTDGRLIRLSASGVPYFDADGKMRGYRGIDLDISDRKKAEELLVQSERMTAVASMAAGVAHNFNNLLQIVVSGLQVSMINLESGDIPSAKKTMDHILESAHFGAKTVSWLQDFASFQGDCEVEGGTVFCLSGTIERAVEMSKPWWKTGPEREGLKILLETNLQPDCRVKARENEIFDVVVNLIKNATEALPAGGNITVSTLLKDGFALFRIKDDGIGISQESQKRLFEPFFTTKGVKGTGMGLASSYGIIRRHGGHISVRSDPGHGAEFEVRLPASGSRSEAGVAVPAEFPWKLRIVLIDDQPLIVTMLTAGLRARGQHVLDATSGEEGSKLFESQGADVVVSDLGMPGMNGWELGERVMRICGAKGWKKPLFILLTGWGKEVVTQNKMTESGVDFVIQKPIDVPRLLDVIRRMMEARKSEPAPDKTPHS